MSSHQENSSSNLQSTQQSIISKRSKQGDAEGRIIKRNNDLCQRCKQPLQMDESCAELAPSTYELISSLLDRSSVFPNVQHPESNAINQPLFNSNHVPFHTNVRQGPGALQSNHLQSNYPSRLVFNSGPSMNQDSARATQSTSNNFRPGPTDSFVVLSESTLGAARAQPELRDNPTLSNVQNSIRTTSTEAGLKIENGRVFKVADLLSRNPSSFEHPLCSECTEKLLEWMDTHTKTARLHRDRYVNFERVLSRERGAEADGSLESCQKIKNDIEQLKIREAEAVERLRKTELESQQVEVELRELESQEAELDAEEKNFWDEYNQYLLDTMDIQSQLDSVTTKFLNDQAELEKLKATNVYKDAFCIGCETGVGTINGLRLGRLADVPVEWVEINAAWGHTALLLQTICRRMNFTINGYRLIPMGSFSRIERTNGDKTSLELFGSDDFALARMLHNRRFDSAMVDFLECLRQASEQVIKLNPKTKILFPVLKDKIGEASIKLSFSSDEAWTSALRYVLFTLKIMNAALDHVAN